MTDDLNQQVQSKARDVQQQDSPQSPEAQVWNYLQKKKGVISRLLPEHMDSQRLATIYFSEIRRTPKLLKCEMGSFFGAVIQSAQLGLEPGVLGHCYFIPYGNQVQFIIGYKGMLELLHRSDQVDSVRVRCVHENDEFDIQYGMNEEITHSPKWDGKRGDIVGVYLIAELANGRKHMEYMNIEEVHERRDRSQAAESGPWVTDYKEMVRKTVVRQAFKYLPISTEIQRTVAHDETIATKLDEADTKERTFPDDDDDGEVIDVQPSPQPQQEEEKKDEEPEPEQPQQQEEEDKPQQSDPAPPSEPETEEWEADEELEQDLEQALEDLQQGKIGGDQPFLR